MNKDSQKSLTQCLKQFTSTCDPEFHEETGGFILNKGDEFTGVWVKNVNTGKPIARALFTASREEYGEKVLAKVLKDGWKEYASFHTHPGSLRAYPSTVDLEQLFTGFPINYIYAPRQKELMCYTYNKEENTWLAKKINLRSNLLELREQVELVLS